MKAWLAPEAAGSDGSDGVVTRVVATLGAAALVLAGPLAREAVATNAHETIVVDAADVDGTETSSVLLAGVSYELSVSGTFRASGDGEADAECARSALGVWSQDRAGRPSLDLLVGGADVQWAPVGSELFGCDTSHHMYRFTVSPSQDGKLALRVDGGADQLSFAGGLTVDVSGPRFGEAPPVEDGADAGNGSPEDGSSSDAAAPEPPPAEPDTPPSADPSTGEPPTRVATTPLGPVSPTPPPSRTQVPEPTSPPVSRRPDVAVLAEVYEVAVPEQAAAAAAGSPPPRSAEVALVQAPPGAPATFPVLLVLLSLGALGTAATTVRIAWPAGRAVRSSLARRRHPNPWRATAARPRTPSVRSQLERSYFE